MNVAMRGSARTGALCRLRAISRRPRVFRSSSIGLAHSPAARHQMTIRGRESMCDRARHHDIVQVVAEAVEPRELEPLVHSRGPEPRRERSLEITAPIEADRA